MQPVKLLTTNRMATTNNRNMDLVSAHKQDLIDAVTLWKQQYNYIIIAGDFYEYSYSEGLLFDMQAQAGLVPATTNLPQSTYLRGNQCLDHVMVTPNSFRIIQDITYLDFLKEYYTDHKPIIININQQSISRTTLPNRNTIGRKLFSQDRKNSKRYLKLRYNLYQKYKIQEKIIALANQIESFNSQAQEVKATIKSTLNKIDKYFTKISIDAEKNLPEKYTVILPKNIIEIRRQITTNRYRLSQAKKAHDASLIAELQKTKRQLKRDLKAQIKEYWESREHAYYQYIDEVGKKESAGK
jgi:hypothetical protein